eukprot:GEMP01058453.1.p1 GENE.GEMP01058453.1~~GEMP01058453.1.p1  ORF type:complete len:185 (+),score=23.62 GEMP01058453.1:53-607(+)
MGGKSSTFVDGRFGADTDIIGQMLSFLRPSKDNGKLVDWFRSQLAKAEYMNEFPDSCETGIGNGPKEIAFIFDSRESEWHQCCYTRALSSAPMYCRKVPGPIRLPSTLSEMGEMEGKENTMMCFQTKPAMRTQHYYEDGCINSSCLGDRNCRTERGSYWCPNSTMECIPMDSDSASSRTRMVWL